jgi:hypothetical protein
MLGRGEMLCRLIFGKKTKYKCCPCKNLSIKELKHAQYPVKALDDPKMELSFTALSLTVFTNGFHLEIITTRYTKYLVLKLPYMQVI